MENAPHGVDEDVYTRLTIRAAAARAATLTAATAAASTAIASNAILKSCANPRVNILL